MATDRREDIDLGMEQKGDGDRTKRAVLELRTSSGFRSGIRSSVTVFWIENGFRSTMLFGDYSKNLATTDKRATQKAIDTQHANVFTQAEINLQVAAAKAHYATKEDVNA